MCCLLFSFYSVLLILFGSFRNTFLTDSLVLISMLAHSEWHFLVNWRFKLHYYSALNLLQNVSQALRFFSVQLCWTTSRYEVIDPVVHWIVQCFATYCFVPLTSLHVSSQVVTFMVDITLQHRQKLPLQK